MSLYSCYLLFSCLVVSDSLQPHGLLQPARPPCPSPSPGAYSNSCPSSRWCHPTISSSVIPFSSCLHSFPASGSLLTLKSALRVKRPKYWSLLQLLLQKQFHVLFFLNILFWVSFLCLAFMIIFNCYVNFHSLCIIFSYLLLDIWAISNFFYYS